PPTRPPPPHYSTLSLHDALPISNASYQAIARARSDVREQGALPPPPYLQDSHYPGARKLGRGVGYVYPHGLPDGISEQELMPEGDRKSTRLNSSHEWSSYAVFCL